MSTGNLIAFFFILTSLIGCKIKANDKVIGAWIVKEVNGEYLKNNLKEGSLISFSEENKFYPENGIWSIHEEEDIAYITIEVEQSNISNINGTYKLTFTPANGNSPSIISLEPITKNQNHYILTRLTFDFQKYY